MTITKIPTSRFVGVCHPCNYPLAVEKLDDTGIARTVREDCPECAKPVELTRLWAVTSMDTCDGSCMGATGAVCVCGCGGANHGGAFVRTIHTWYEVQEAVKKYRATSAKRSEAAKKAAATRAATKAATKAANKQAMIDGWFASLEGAEAAAIEWLTAADGESLTSFLYDMRDYVVRFKNGNGKYVAPLTERQLAAVVKCHTRELEWAARNAQRETERAAEAEAAKPVPLGNGLTVEGEIVHTKSQDGYAYNSVEYKMLVKGDGWKVWATIPNALFDGGMNIDTLKGHRVRFVANVELGRDGDPSFGVAKRPRRAELIDA